MRCFLFYEYVSGSVVYACPAKVLISFIIQYTYFSLIYSHIHSFNITNLVTMIMMIINNYNDMTTCHSQLCT